MIDNSTPDFHVVRLDDLPPLFALLERMQVAALLDELFPQHSNWAGALSFGQVAVGWQVYLLSTSDHCLNHVQDWVAQRLPVYSACLGTTVRALDFSDDRLAYVLDKLQEVPPGVVPENTCWSRFETRLNQRLMRVYDLHPERVRLDPSTVSTYAPVNEQGLLRLGHSKDGRPGDAQLKFQLGLLDPLALPLVTQVVAGNSADDPLYAPAIRQAQATVGAGGKTYIGDGKMGALATRVLLAASRDFYLCPLGDKQLPPPARRALINAVLRGEIKRQPIQREQVDARGLNPPVVEEIAEGGEVRVKMKARHEGKIVRWTERRFVIRSHAYARAEAAALEQRLTRAETELRELAERKQGKRRLDKRETRAAAEQILARQRVTDLLAVQVKSHTTQQAVRKYKDRPAGTRKETTITVTVTRQEDAITQVKEQLGWRVYATNHPDLTMSEAVLAYREQYRIEDGISRLKGRPLGLAPMYLQTESRMVGLIYFLTIALRVLTLVEFQVRRGLQAEGKTLTGVYAGQPGRQTARPSTELLLAALRGVDAAYGTGVRYLRPLTAAQKRILQLLELDEQLYEKLLLKFQNLASG